jgi:hypothetical protein
MPITNIEIINILRTDKFYEPQKNKIYLQIKIMQATFSSAALLSLISAFLTAAPLISGGSLMYFGIPVAFRFVSAIFFLDALKVSSNLSAISKTNVISKYATQIFGSSAGKATKAVEDYFDGPDLDPKKKLSAQELAHKIVKGTLLLHPGEAFVLQFLKKNA